MRLVAARRATGPARRRRRCWPTSPWTPSARTPGPAPRSCRACSSAAPRRTRRERRDVRGAGAGHRPPARPGPPVQRLRRARRRAAQRAPGAGRARSSSCASSPERLTGEIGDFLDDVLEGPRAAAVRRARAASPRLPDRPWPVEQRRRNAGARSASRRRRRRRKAAARKRTLQIGGGVVLGLAVIAVHRDRRAGRRRQQAATRRPTSSQARRRRRRPRGCTFSQFKSEGRNHTASKVTYKTNPPTSGNHNPTPAQDGIYRAGNSPPKENFVHTLEHGRIEFQYKPGTPAADVAKLRKLAEEPFNGTAGYHVLLFENNTNMPAQFAATAWTNSITCPDAHDRGRSGPCATSARPSPTRAPSSSRRPRRERPPAGWHACASVR